MPGIREDLIRISVRKIQGGNLGMVLSVALEITASRTWSQRCAKSPDVRALESACSPGQVPPCYWHPGGGGLMLVLRTALFTEARWGLTHLSHCGLSPVGSHSVWCDSWSSWTWACPWCLVSLRRWEEFLLFLMLYSIPWKCSVILFWEAFFWGTHCQGTPLPSCQQSRRRVSGASCRKLPLPRHVCVLHGLHAPIAPQTLSLWGSAGCYSEVFRFKDGSRAMVRVRPMPVVTFFCPQQMASIGLHHHLTPLWVLRCNFCFLVVI